MRGNADRLIPEFVNDLSILQSVHGAVALQTSIKASKWCLPCDLYARLQEICRCAREGAGALHEELELAHRPGTGMTVPGRTTGASPRGRSLEHGQTQVSSTAAQSLTSWTRCVVSQGTHIGTTAQADLCRLHVKGVSDVRANTSTKGSSNQVKESSCGPLIQKQSMHRRGSSRLKCTMSASISPVPAKMSGLASKLDWVQQASFG